VYQDSNSDPSVVQPIAGRYTDCTIPSPKLNYYTVVTSIIRKLGVKSDNRLWDNHRSDNQDTTVLDVSTLTVEYNHMMSLVFSVDVCSTNTLI
jgi:hypothetical protein